MKNSQLKHFLCAAVFSLSLITCGCAARLQETPSSPQPLPQTKSTDTSPTNGSSTPVQSQLKQITDQTVAPPQIASEDSVQQDNKDRSDIQGEKFEPIYFGFDSFALDKPAGDAIGRNYRIIRSGSGDYAVAGYCDERGDDAYNAALGERRAKAVFNYLVTLGIAPERLRAISYGEEYPADPGHSEEAWAKNRRVQIRLLEGGDR